LCRRLSFESILSYLKSIMSFFSGPKVTSCAPVKLMQPTGYPDFEEKFACLIQINGARFLWNNIPTRNPTSLPHDLNNSSPQNNFDYDNFDDHAEDDPDSPQQCPLQTPRPIMPGQRNTSNLQGDSSPNDGKRDWFQPESSFAAHWDERDRELYGITITFVDMLGVAETDKQSQIRMMIWTWMVRSTDIPGGMFQYYHKKVEQGNVRELQKLLRASCDQPSLIQLATLLKKFTSLRLTKDETFDKYCHTQDDVCKKMSHLGFIIPDRLQSALILLQFRNTHPFQDTVKTLNLLEPEPTFEKVCRLMLKAETLEKQSREHKSLNSPRNSSQDDKAPRKDYQNNRQRRQNKPSKYEAANAEEANAVTKDTSTKASEAPEGVCKQYYAKGKCSWGKDCRYKHSSKPGKAPSQRKVPKGRNTDSTKEECQLCGSPQHSMDDCPQLPPTVRTRLKAIKKSDRKNSANLAEAEVEDEDEEEAQIMETDSLCEQVYVAHEAHNVTSVERKYFAFDTAATIVMVMNAIYLLEGTAKPVKTKILEATSQSRTLSTIGGIVRFRFSDERYLDMQALVVPNLRRNLFSGMQFDKLGNHATLGDGLLTLYNAKKELLYRAPRDERNFFFIPWIQETRAELTSRIGLPESAMLQTQIANAADFTAEALIAPTYFRAPTQNIMHGRFCHISNKLIQLAVPKIPMGKKQCCRWCMQGKTHARPVPKAATIREYKPNERNDWDIIGPWPHRSLKKNRYALLGVDKATAHVTPIGIKTKSDSQSEIIGVTLALEMDTKRLTSEIHTDVDSCFTSLEVLNFFKSKGIRHSMSVPGVHQHGILDELASHIQTLYATVMLESCLPNKLWEEIVKAICVVINLLPRKMISSKGKEIITSRRAAFTGRKSEWTVDRLRVLGCYAVVKPFPAPKKRRPRKKALEGVMVGYDTFQKGYRIWIPSLGKVKEIHNVTFEEDYFPYAELRKSGERRRNAFSEDFAEDSEDSSDNSNEDEDYSDNDEDYSENSDNQDPHSEIEDPHSQDEDSPPSDFDSPKSEVEPSDGLPLFEEKTEIAPKEIPLDDSTESKVKEAVKEPPSPESKTEPAESSSSKMPSKSPPLMKYKGKRISDDHFLDLVTAAASHTETEVDPLASLAQVIFRPGIQTSFMDCYEAAQCEESDLDPKWQSPKGRSKMLKHPLKEIFVLKEQSEMLNYNSIYNALKLVPRYEVPPGTQILRPHWVYTVSPDENWEPKARSRLVIGGEQQTHLKPEDCFSGVVRQTNLLMLFTLFVNDRSTPVPDKTEPYIIELDQTAAYLAADVSEKMFCHQVPGYEVEGRPNYLYRVMKAMYGARKSGRDYQTLQRAVFIEELGYKQNDGDMCIYHKFDKNGSCNIATQVDNIFVQGNSLTLKNELITYLCHRFVMKVLGFPKILLKIKVEYFPDEHSIHLCQERYITKWCTQFGINRMDPVDTPFDPNAPKLSSSMAPTSDVDKEFMKFREPMIRPLIGNLWWTSSTLLVIRPRLQNISMMISCFGKAAWKALMWLCRYVYKIRKSGLWIRRKHWRHLLLVFVDCANKANPDTMRARECYVEYLMGTCINLHSCEQKLSALSSTEGEYMAQNHAGQEIVYRNKVLDGFRLNSRPAMLLGDSKSARLIALNPCLHKMSKYVSPYYHRQRQWMSEGEYWTGGVTSGNNVSDQGTKFNFAKGIWTRYANFVQDPPEDLSFLFDDHPTHVSMMEEVLADVISSCSNTNSQFDPDTFEYHEVHMVETEDANLSNPSWLWLVKAYIEHQIDALPENLLEDLPAFSISMSTSFEEDGNPQTKIITYDHIDTRGFYVCERERTGSCPLAQELCKDSHQPSAAIVPSTHAQVVVRRNKRFSIEVFHELCCKYFITNPLNYYRMPRLFATAIMPTPLRPVPINVPCCSRPQLILFPKRSSPRKKPTPKPPSPTPSPKKPTPRKPTPKPPSPDPTPKKPPSKNNKRKKPSKRKTLKRKKPSKKRSKPKKSRKKTTATL
jgi:hypothetical protein